MENIGIEMGNDLLVASKILFGVFLLSILVFWWPLPYKIKWFLRLSILGFLGYIFYIVMTNASEISALVNKIF